MRERRAAEAMLGLGVAVAVGVLVAGPAAAAGARPGLRADARQSTIATPCGSGVCSVVDDDGYVVVTAIVDRSHPLCVGHTLDTTAVTLTVTQTGAGLPLASASNASGDCTSVVQAAFDPYTTANGQYVAMLSGDGASARSTFTLALPARKPATPTATVVPGHQAVGLRWTANSESGVSYAVVEANGTPAEYVSGGAPAPDPTDVTKAVATVVAAPGLHTYKIEAVRAGTTTLVVSAPSNAVAIASTSVLANPGATPTGPARAASGAPVTSGDATSSGAGSRSRQSAGAGSTPVGGGSAAPSMSGSLPELPTPSASPGDDGTTDPSEEGTDSPPSRDPGQAGTQETGMKGAAETSDGDTGLIDCFAAALVVILVAGQLGAVARHRSGHG